jgi:putative methylase
VKKKDFEKLLQNITPIENPRSELEQYSTPANIAADILWIAYYNSDINDKTVFDLGCGTGIFTIGAALLHANYVVGIDIDESLINIAKQTAKKFSVSVEFVPSDIEKFECQGDTVIMNPPFGSQYPNRNADQKFLQKAIKISSSIYSLHLTKSADFIRKFFSYQRWEIFREKHYRFPIKASFSFHEKKIINYDVVMIHARKLQSQIISK